MSIWIKIIMPKQALRLMYFKKITPLIQLLKTPIGAWNQASPIFSIQKIQLSTKWVQVFIWIIMRIKILQQQIYYYKEAMIFISQALPASLLIIVTFIQN